MSSVECEVWSMRWCSFMHVGPYVMCNMEYGICNVYRSKNIFNFQSTFDAMPNMFGGTVFCSIKKLKQVQHIRKLLCYFPFDSLLQSQRIPFSIVFYFTMTTKMLICYNVWTSLVFAIAAEKRLLDQVESCLLWSS